MPGLLSSRSTTGVAFPSTRTSRGQCFELPGSETTPAASICHVWRKVPPLSPNARTRDEGHVQTVEDGMSESGFFPFRMAQLGFGFTSASTQGIHGLSDAGIDLSSAAAAGPGGAADALGALAAAMPKMQNTVKMNVRRFRILRRIIAYIRPRRQNDLCRPPVLRGMRHGFGTSANSCKIDPWATPRFPRLPKGGPLRRPFKMPAWQQIFA